MSTKEALLQSIEHWEDNLNKAETTGSLDTFDISPHKCALCHMFMLNIHEPKDTCCGCPVYEKVKSVGCCRTPYGHVKSSILEGDPPEVLIDAIKAELEFLKSLLI